MLSLACFFKHLKLWVGSTTPLSGILATDNTGLITRVQAQEQIKYSLPNSTFQPNWDVVQAIVETLQSAHIEATYEHVKGHQDDDVPVESLSLLAQLNVEADHHAGVYLTSFGSYSHIIPLSPTCPITLNIDGKTIHRGFKQAIRDAIHGNDLLEEMQLRYNWEDGILDTIDWEVHCQVTQAQLS